MILSLKTYLSKRLTEELPGKTAQIEAIPYRKTDYGTFNIDSARKSGVLILFYLKENTPHIALIQRPIYEGTHSGQIALPGGKVEETDRDIFHTALREANEEIGIIMDDVEVLGKLTNMYIPVSNFMVTPVIGIVDYSPDFIPDQREVAEIIDLKISNLTEIEQLSINKVRLTNGLKMEVPTFELNDKIVWGATAVILNELRHVLRNWTP